MSFAQAAEPREELLRLVPDSVGFCVVIQDLRGHAAALQNSPLVEQLGRSPFAIKIRASEDVKKLDRFESKMKEKLGLDWARLRDDILGDALVLIYQPGPPGKPDQEQGALLIRARNAKILADLIERVNKVQKEEGELKELEERRHNGTVYYRRLEFDKRTERDKPPTFYYVHGPILALSSQESMIRQMIECDQAHSSTTVPEAARRLRDLGAEHALLAMWVNPRAFDADLDAKATCAASERCIAVQHFARYWKALDSIVLSLSPDERDINLSLGVRARVAELPAAAQRLFREAATASDVWQRFPESALLAVGSRIDGTALLEVVGGFLMEKDRRTLDTALNRQLGALLLFGEANFVRDVLPALGPDWGLCVTAPQPREKSWLPQSLFALRIAADRTKKPVERKLLAALDSAARLIIFAHNSQNTDTPLALKNAEVDGKEIRYLSGENTLPAGVQPAYGVCRGYLILASSLGGLTRFAQSPPTALPSGEKNGREGTAVVPVPLLRISFKHLRAYLSEHRESLVQSFADVHKLSRDNVERQLDGLLAGFQFVDRLELRQRVAPGQVIFTLKVRTAHALKK